MSLCVSGLVLFFWAKKHLRNSAINGFGGCKKVCYLAFELISIHAFISGRDALNPDVFGGDTVFLGKKVSDTPCLKLIIYHTGGFVPAAEGGKSRRIEYRGNKLIKGHTVLTTDLVLVLDIRRTFGIALRKVRIDYDLCGTSMNKASYECLFVILGSRYRLPVNGVENIELAFGVITNTGFSLAVGVFLFSLRHTPE